MRYFITILLLFIGFIAVAQVDSVGLKNSIQILDKALMERDSAVLSAVLHKDLSYGHSSGWVQTKNDLWNDFVSGKLVYKKIENSSITISAINKNWAIVRTNTSAEGTVNDKGFNLTLHVLQVWMKTNKGWQLMARQSAKL